MLRDELLDARGAETRLKRALESRPEYEEATAALESIVEKRAKWRDLVATYESEAESAPDDVYKASMLMRASEAELLYGGDMADADSAVDRLEQAFRLDSSNQRASCRAFSMPASRSAAVPCSSSSSTVMHLCSCTGLRP